MGMAEEFRRRFLGTWNVVVLTLVVLVCFRFAGAEWKEAPLEIRSLCAAYLLLGVAAFGALCAAVRWVASRRESGAKPDAAAIVAGGLRFGVVAGGALVFLWGLTQVEGFLGPLGELVAKLFSNAIDALK